MGNRIDLDTILEILYNKRNLTKKQKEAIESLKELENDDRRLLEEGKDE